MRKECSEAVQPYIPLQLLGMQKRRNDSIMDVWSLSGGSESMHIPLLFDLQILTNGKKKKNIVSVKSVWRRKSGYIFLLWDYLRKWTHEGVTQNCKCKVREWPIHFNPTNFRNEIRQVWFNLVSVKCVRASSECAFHLHVEWINKCDSTLKACSVRHNQSVRFTLTASRKEWTKEWVSGNPVKLAAVRYK